VESEETLANYAAAAEKIPGVLEYIGCFYGGTLVSFSENYIQKNAVWLANIRHDPAYLNEYSSYGFMDGILDYYLNQKKMDYVLDGCRSIHHKTSFQEHLAKVFGFTKEYAILNVKYSAGFKIAVKLAYPFKSIFWRLSDKWMNTTVDNIGAVLRQEYIRSSCADL
jgi:flagellar biosynthesis/type III secretory pathway ATPase